MEYSYTVLQAEKNIATILGINPEFVTLDTNSENIANFKITRDVSIDQGHIGELREAIREHTGLEKVSQVVLETQANGSGMSEDVKSISIFSDDAINRIATIDATTVVKTVFPSRRR